MKQVLEHIEASSREFARLEYFQLLEKPGTWSDVAVMAQGLSFFVLSFQDMLRLNAVYVTDARFSPIAREQRRDDAGHDAWFLSDLEQLRLLPSLSWTFGKNHRVTRDASYEIMAEIIKASSDAARIAIGLSLEATGGAYFSRIHGFMAQLGLEEGLRFFSRHHWEAEQSHDVLQEHGRQRIEAIELTPAEGFEACAAAQRTFDSIRRMCEDLAARMLARRAADGLLAAPELAQGWGAE